MRKLLFILFTAISLSVQAVTPTALLVVGNGSLNTGDLAINSRLQTLGYSVTIKSAASTTAADATGKSLVIISSTVASGDVNNKLTHVAVPLINYENALFDDLEMAGTNASNYGSQSSITQVNIINAGHPLAAGLANGNVGIYTTSNDVTWAKVNANAIKIATHPTDAQKIALFGFEAGVLMDDLVAPARRVGIFLDDDGANLLTAQGLQLLDAAITWAANVSVQNSPPSVSITSPANGASFAPGVSIPVSATASDGDGSVAQLKFFVGGNTLVTGSSTYSFSWDGAPLGQHSITVRAYDNEGDSSSATVNIVVEIPNLAPSVTITSPAAGANFIAPAEIIINADAADNDGSIVKVEFFSGNNLLAVDSTAGYSFIWTNVPGGNYSLTAKATDNGGKTTTSSAVNIIVEDTSFVPVKEALFLVGSTTLNSGDAALKNRLEALGFTVTTKAASASVTADATGKNLVFISATVTSTAIASKFTNVATPVILCENALMDDLKMTGGSGNYGSQSTVSQVVITNSAHPLAAGLSNGTIAVYTGNDILTWGTPTANAAVIATVPGSTSKAAIFGYEVGAAMQGMNAPARRVGFFLNDNGAAMLTSQGMQLLNAAISWAASLNVPNTPPSVNITSPNNGALFTTGDDVSITATASDIDGTIARVRFYANGNLLFTDTQSPYSFQWNDVATGNYTISARAFGNKNDSASASINIVAEPGNAAPTVSITSPAAGTNFIAPAEILITADAADSDGSIVKVEFYSGNNLLGVDSTSGYSVLWSNVPGGNYSLTAKAYDNGGKTTTSGAVNVVVEDTSFVSPKNALLVVGNTNLNNSDAAIKNRLEVLNFFVTVKQAASSSAADATGKHLVFISSTVSSGDITSKFNNVAVAVILCENALMDDLKLTGGSGNYGTQSSENEVVIANSAHPLAGGLSAGTKLVYSANDILTWGKPTANAAVIATIPGNTTKAAVFGYEAGAAMQGLNAPARRVGFFLNDNGAALLTADGWKLFDAAVVWATNTSAVIPNVPPVVTITSPANNAEFTEPATVNITVNVSDGDGTITKVEFYQGNNLIGASGSSPFSFAWNNIAEGNYVLKAKAFDDDNATTFSNTTNILVNEPSPGDTADLPFSISITSPNENAVFLENADVSIKAAVAAEGPVQSPYLKVTNDASSWKKLKMGSDATTVFGANKNVVAGGNTTLQITLRDLTGTAQWNKIQFKPNGSSLSPSSLQDYVTAAGGVGNEWKTISIPLSAFSGFDFTKVSYLEFPSCKGAAAFQIGIQKIVFTGGSTPFLWFGDPRIDNAHDGKGNAGQLVAELITGAVLPTISKVEFYQGSNLLGSDVSAPYELAWNDVPLGNYTLTARAYQSNEFVVSAPVHIHVDEAIGDTVTITVTFNGVPSAVTVEKAALKYNKDFAYSYTIDDGHMDGYRIIYRMFGGGLNEYDNVVYPGMFYTDGCGNNVPFKAGYAWHSVNSLGQDLHESRSTDNRMTWAELSEVHAAGYDVINHSYSHAANGENTDHAFQVSENAQYVKSKTGIDMTHFAVPSGDERYVDPAFNNGMIAVYDQTGSGFYPSIVQVDAPLDLNLFKLKRHFIQNSTHDESNITDEIEEAASESGNGEHYWYNNASHNVTADFGGNLEYPVFKHFIEFVDEHYGKDGADNMWMAPLQEVYEYLAVKQATVVATDLDGNQLEIKLLLNNVPDGLRRYALTLNIDADVDFNAVTVHGTSQYCFDGIGEAKLINLDWTGVHPNKIFKTTSNPASQLPQPEDERQEFEMSASPNPVTDVVTVKIDNSDERNVNIVVLDMLGRNVLSIAEKLQEGVTQFDFDMTRHGSGFYFIKVWTEDGVERVEKFVKR